MREFVVALQRARDENEHTITLAWLTARLSRMPELPPLASLLERTHAAAVEGGAPARPAPPEGEPQPRRQSVAEQRAVLAVIAQQYGLAFKPGVPRGE